MLSNHTIVAIIPARGGSKRLPRKNVKQLLEKPLVAYTIMAALESRFVDRVIVSSEDEEILAIAQSWGAEAPFVRPEELSAEDVDSVEPMIHATRWLKQQGCHPDYVMCLQCTSPLRTSEHIDEAITQCIQRGAEGLISLGPATKHPLWYRTMDEQLMVREMVNHRDNHGLQRPLSEIFCPNGAIFMVKAEVLLEQNTLFPANTIGYIMDEESSLDIDTPFQFKIAEWLLAQRYHQKECSSDE